MPNRSVLKPANDRSQISVKRSHSEKYGVFYSLTRKRSLVRVQAGPPAKPLYLREIGGCTHRPRLGYTASRERCGEIRDFSFGKG